MLNRTTLDSQPSRSSVQPPPRGLFTRWPRTSDAVLATVVFLWSVFASFEGPNEDFVIRDITELPTIVIFVFAAASCALYWRRSRPLVVLGLNFVALIALLKLGYPTLWAMPFALYSVGRYATNNQWSYYAVGASMVMSASSSVIDGEPLGSIGFAIVFVFLIWYIGRRIQARGDYLRLLQEHAVAEERTRIARELHDIVAHRVTLMTVQAGAAKTVAADDPEAALEAMEAVEREGRQTLGELRHLLGVLRPQAEVDGLGPQPGIADIPRLVEQLGEAGLDVSLTMDDVRTDLPARVDVSGYRIVQEALTNVLKHAGPTARTEVRISTDNDDLAIEVFDNGPSGTTLPGSGHGIVGMLERAQLLGGHLDAGAGPGGGFQVIAHLPIGAQPA